MLTRHYCTSFLEFAKNLSWIFECGRNVWQSYNLAAALINLGKTPLYKYFCGVNFCEYLKNINFTSVLWPQQMQVIILHILLRSHPRRMKSVVVSAARGGHRLQPHNHCWTFDFPELLWTNQKHENRRVLGLEYREGTYKVFQRSCSNPEIRRMREQLVTAFI